MKTETQKSNQSKDLFLIFNDQKMKYITIKGEIWFKGKDVAKVLGYKKTTSALEKHIDNAEKRTLGQLDTPQNGAYVDPNNPTMKTIYINESGLYRLIMRSKLKNDDIEKFQDWVTSYVLPSIRKTGKYECHKNLKLCHISMTCIIFSSQM